MRLLIAPQEFKGTLTAVQATRVLADAIARVWPDAEQDLAPLADGGPGTVEAIVSTLNGERRTTRVQGPLGNPVSAAWGVVEGGTTAVIEMAAASGISILDAASLDIRRASTFGTGELIKAALDAGCRRVIVGLGGSATNDGGVGAASALGIRFLDAQGDPLPPGGAALHQLARIDASSRDERLQHAELWVLTDVTNALLGVGGATHVYGPQKGASREMVMELDEALAHLAKVARRDLGADLANTPRTGAAGGLAFGLATFCRGRLLPGFDIITDVLGLQARLTSADVVITGEGRLDEQTAHGKGPWGIAQKAKAQQKHVVLFAGQVRSTLGASTPFDEVVTISPPDLSRDEARARAEEFLFRAATQWAEARQRTTATKARVSPAR